VTAKQRVLPDFLIIGAQKCGTTSLYDYLVQHPAVLPARYKEPRYFTRNYKAGVDWYRSQFPLAWVRDGLAKVRGEPILTGEATPGMILYPWTASRVRQLLPGMKIIALLRNPIDRAYSGYYQMVRIGEERLGTFEEAIDAEPGRVGVEFTRMIDDPDYHSVGYGAFTYLTRGIYVDQLLRWAKEFPMNQIHVIDARELYREPMKVYARVLEFLGLSPYDRVRLERRNVAPEYSPMSPATRERLIEFYRPHNARLYEWLGRDFGWDK
jgi:hypothetical protein